MKGEIIARLVTLCGCEKFVKLPHYVTEYRIRIPEGPIVMDTELLPPRHIPMRSRIFEAEPRADYFDGDTPMITYKEKPE